MSAISDQYAVALFELSKADEKTDRVSEDFDSFIKSFDENSMTFFKHPAVKKNKKVEIVQTLDLDPLFKNFLSVLIENNRFDYLYDIRESYESLLDNMHKRMHVVVYSKRPLKKQQINALQEEYEKKYSRQVTVENKVDELIIGGLRFEFEGKVIDDTVNHTLRELKSRLTK